MGRVVNWQGGVVYVDGMGDWVVLKFMLSFLGLTSKPGMSFRLVGLLSRVWQLLTFILCGVAGLSHPEDRTVCAPAQRMPTARFTPAAVLN